MQMFWLDLIKLEIKNKQFKIYLNFDPVYSTNLNEEEGFSLSLFSDTNTLKFYTVGSV